MALPEIWHVNNDVVLTLSGVRSSTMASTAYLTSSTNVKVSVWKALTTASTANRLVNARVMTYVSASNGNYRTVVQSTESTAITDQLQGLAIFTVNHSGLNGEWRMPFQGNYRRTT